MNGRISILVLMCFWACQSQSTYRHGEILYNTHCASCHMEDGSGLEALYPAVANSDYLRKRLDELPCIIQNGLYDTITVNGIQYDQAMLGVKELNETEICNVVNFIRHKWYPDSGVINPRVLESQLIRCN